MGIATKALGDEFIPIIRSGSVLQTSYLNTNDGEVYELDEKLVMSGDRERPPVRRVLLLPREC
jgi:adenine/guanine phosphoribosyltransferase-like PRPP-binding protein